MSKNMRVARRAFIGALGSVSVLGAVRGFAQQRPRVNYEYRLIEPQPVSSGNRIEVLEFFWYGCPYCYQLQGPLEAWLKAKPGDVELRRVPAIFRESWVPHARVYYTLEALGEVDRLHQVVYRTMHQERLDLNSAGVTTDWATRNGIDPARWTAAYGSADVDRRIEESRRFTRSYAVQGTPSLVVDGRLLTSSGMTETVAAVIPILDDLIQMAREQRASK